MKNYLQLLLLLLFGQQSDANEGNFYSGNNFCFKGSPPVLIFGGVFRISWRYLILLVLLINFGPYIKVLKSRDHGEIGL